MTLLKEIVSTSQINEASDEVRSEFWESFDETAINTAEQEIEELLFELIKTKVNIEISKSSRGRSNEIGLTIESNNLAPKMSPKMFDTLKVSDFNGNLTDDGYYWLQLNYEYNHIGGGTNGTNICHLFLDKDGSIYKTNTKY